MSVKKDPWWNRFPLDKFPIILTCDKYSLKNETIKHPRTLQVNIYIQILVEEEKEEGEEEERAGGGRRLGEKEEYKKKKYQYQYATSIKYY